MTYYNSGPQGSLSRSSQSQVSLPQAQRRDALLQRWRRIEALPDALYTTEQVRELDRLAISGGIAGSVLMKRAARATLEALVLRWPEHRSLRVYCGTGNNGGDGYWLAALAVEQGLRATVIEVGDPGKLVGDAALAREKVIEAKVAVLAGPGAVVQGVDDDCIVVDAILGTGLRGDVRQNAASAIDAINHSEAPVVAVDIPSGLCSDSGEILGNAAVIADLTVTFIGIKCGLLTGKANDCVGELSFSDLGVPENVYQQVEPFASLMSLGRQNQHLPQRQATAYKNHSGHLLLIAGDSGMAGAASLAATAALRCGAGLVSVATRAAHVSAIVGGQPELMVYAVEQAEELQPLLSRATALVIGPGLGQSSWSQQMLNAALNWEGPALLDADALNLLAQRPEDLQASQRVLTPHPGEARRLLAGVMPDKLTGSSGPNRFDVAASLQRRYGASVVLKGAGSIVATGRGDAASKIKFQLCSYGNSGMATAGMGDVLSGVIGSLLAQRLPTDKATALGVSLHSAAADWAVCDTGQRGLVASDLWVYLRKIMNLDLENLRSDTAAMSLE